MGTSKDPEMGEPVEGIPAYYGTFQGQANYPQPVPPSQAPHYPQSQGNYQFQTAGQSMQGSLQNVQGRVMEGRPVFGGDNFQRGDKLPFCDLGFGWFLFIFGFLFVIPWYIGAIIFFCMAHDYRERTGLMACAIASLVCILAGGTRAMV